MDGLACLQALASGGAPIGVRPLSRELGLNPTRINRLLKTLAHLGLARQGPDRKYSVGPAIHVLSAQTLFASGLIRRAVGPLAALSPLGLTVAMGVLWKDRVCYLYRAAPGSRVEEALGHVRLSGALGSSIGLVLLAAQGPDYVDRHIHPEDAERFRGPAGLRERLETICRRGWAVLDVLDAPPGTVTVGAPLGTPPHAGIALSGPKALLNVEERVDHLHRVIREIESETNLPETPPTADQRRTR